jgi:hypothetical protein
VKPVLRESIQGKTNNIYIYIPFGSQTFNMATENNSSICGDVHCYVWWQRRVYLYTYLSYKYIYIYICITASWESTQLRINRGWMSIWDVRVNVKGHSQHESLVNGRDWDFSPS